MPTISTGGGEGGEGAKLPTLQGCHAGWFGDREFQFEGLRSVWEGVAAKWSGAGIAEVSQAEMLVSLHAVTGAAEC